MNNEERQLAKWFFNLIGYFNHYSFFTKKLWKQVKGFKHVDEAEIKCMFMHYWFHHKFGYFTVPCGIEWFMELDKDSYDKYISRYQPVIDTFEQWKIEQR